MSAEVVVDGLFTGAVYALVALGLAVVFQPTRILNFAQGEAVVLGAAVCFQVVALSGLGWGTALVLALVLAALAGVLMERMIILPVRLSGSRYAWIIATLAVALVFQSVFTLLYTDVSAFRPPPLVPGDLTMFGVRVAGQQAATIGVALLVMGAYDVFLSRAAYGRAIRAAAHRPDTAVLMGVPVRRVVVLSFVIGTVVTALAGVLASPILFVAPATGLLFTIKGFTAAVIGGIGSPRGALVGGLVVGLLDTVLRNVIGGSAGNIATFVVLAVILVAFPSGLFGKPVVAH